MQERHKLSENIYTFFSHPNTRNGFPETGHLCSNTNTNNNNNKQHRSPRHYTTKDLSPPEQHQIGNATQPNRISPSSSPATIPPQRSRPSETIFTIPPAPPGKRVTRPSTDYRATPSKA